MQLHFPSIKHTCFPLNFLPGVILAAASAALIILAAVLVAFFLALFFFPGDEGVTVPVAETGDGSRAFWRANNIILGSTPPCGMVTFLKS